MGRDDATHTPFPNFGQSESFWRGSLTSAARSAVFRQTSKEGLQDILNIRRFPLGSHGEQP
jgi:hypothetical protein